MVSTSLIVLMVSVDVKHRTMPESELRSCVKVEVAVLDSDVKQHQKKKKKSPRLALTLTQGSSN